MGLFDIVGDVVSEVGGGLVSIGNEAVSFAETIERVANGEVPSVAGALAGEVFGDTVGNIVSAAGRGDLWSIAGTICGNERLPGLPQILAGTILGESAGEAVGAVLDGQMLHAMRWSINGMSDNESNVNRSEELSLSEMMQMAGDYRRMSIQSSLFAT